VLRRFPLIIRLRNDADLRAARKYLTVEARIMAELDKMDPPDGGGEISAVRFFTRSGREELTADRLGADPATASP
jgi:hypothetical protein